MFSVSPASLEPNAAAGAAAGQGYAGDTDAAAFESELASLPGKYAPPDGRLLLATQHSRPAGCVALRRIDNESCEMKRMFVDEAVQGQGVGRALDHEAEGAGGQSGRLRRRPHRLPAERHARRSGARGARVKRLLGLVGATVGSALGWWIGAHVGIMTAVIMSAIGTGVGLWAAVRLASDHLI